MKRVRTFIAAAVASAAFMSAFGGDSDSYEDSNRVEWTFGYTYNGNVATITRVVTTNVAAGVTAISVPDSFAIGTDAMTVTEIKDGAFDGCTNINRVYLSPNVIEVTGAAFRNMGGNVSVSAPDTLEDRLVSGTYGTTTLTVSYYFTAQDIPLAYANFTKAQTVKAAYYGKGFNGAVAELKFARAGKSRNGLPRTVKLTATFTAPDGSKQRVRATLKVNDDGSTAEPANIRLKLNGMTEEDFALNIAGGKVSLKSASYTFAKAKVGGVIDKSVTQLPFYAVGIVAGFDKMPALASGWELLLDGGLSPSSGTGIPVSILNGRKFSVPKSVPVKLKKNKDGTATLTGVDGSANKCALKLTYNVKTGLFRGSFKLYALNAAQKRLKAYTVKVTGHMIQDCGYGSATLRNPKGGPWSVYLMNSVG